MSKILGVHIPTPQNLAINGAMDFFQRNGSNLITVNGTAAGGGYSADMVVTDAAGTTAKNFYYGKSTNVPTVAQAGFAVTNSTFIATNIAVTSFASTDLYEPFQYRMEGFDFAKIHQKTATFGFWFNPFTTSGTFSFSIRNQAINRSYVTTFQASVGWQFISITVPLDQAGTWNFDNSVGSYIGIASIGGTTNQTSTLNAWQAGNFSVASTATNFLTTGGSSGCAITLFSIVEGTLGFGPTGFARCGKDIQQELALCQRYCETGTYNVIGYAPSGSILSASFQYTVTKRASPTVTFVRTGGNSMGATTTNYSGSPTSLTVGATSTLTGTSNFLDNWTADAGL